MISHEIINFINQTEDIFNYKNLDNLQSIYHYSIPNVKLAYPEPFIASASFMHSDLWFMHILIYQYWLWFAFIFIIVFFFLTFICTIRWCNLRVRPKKETRGVSRSKCGDLITACVPVSWATSIIVNESTDAIDYFDGFGTTELVIGIRAYQWGWEYYYPKDLDLNYNIKKNYSTFIGNSLKYNKTSSVNLNHNNLWKFYQNKNFDQIVTPAHLLLIPSDNFKFLNFLNFNDVGSNAIFESNSFKKIKMFSKVNNTNLFYNFNSFSTKYKKFISYYRTNESFLDASSYGLKRQQNFTSKLALLNNCYTFLDLNSVNHFVSYCLNSRFFFKKDFSPLMEINFFNYSTGVEQNHTELLKFENMINLKKKTKNVAHFINFLNYNYYLNQINNNSDKKKINYPINKLFSNYFSKSNFLNKENTFKILNKSDISFFSNQNETGNFFFNKNKNILNYSMFSQNQNISLNDRSVRNFSNLKPTTPILNSSTDLNTLNGYKNFQQNKINFSNLSFYNLHNLDWIDYHATFNLFFNRLIIDYPHPPVFSNNPIIGQSGYDSYNKTKIAGTPQALSGKEESIPNFLTSIYWNFYWSNSSPDWRLKNDKTYFFLNKNFYLPTFNFYYDYDFRNWQSFELLEDSYWESNYSTYLLDEYLVLIKDFNLDTFINKNDLFFTELNKNLDFRNKEINKMPLNDLNSSGEFYVNSFFNEDFFSPLGLLKTKNFFLFPFSINYLNMEESYDNFKYLNYFYNFNNNNLIVFANYNSNTLNYKTVLDYFRSNFDEFSWFTDDVDCSNFLPNSFEKINYGIRELANQNLDTLFNFKDFNFIFKNVKVSDFRFTNYLNTRSTAKNSLVTYNAMQKVFRTRFDENRSHTKLTDFSSFSIKQPFITSPRVPYERILGKNKNSFYNPLIFKNKFNNFFNFFHVNFSTLNYYFFDFPFLIAMKSDSARYLWFDWFAKWGFYEVQPSSASRYAIFGLPFFNKNFDFGAYNSDNLTETETYLSRIAVSRKNYLQNWTFSPYFYLRNNVWSKANELQLFSLKSLNFLSLTKFYLNYSSWYWTLIDVLDTGTYKYHPSNSNINSFTKTSWKNLSSPSSYYYYLENSADVLTKREYLFRELFFKKNKIIKLPSEFVASPTNPVYKEIKSNFSSTNLQFLTNEYSKNIFFNSLTYFNYKISNFLTKNTAPILHSFVGNLFSNLDLNNGRDGSDSSNLSKNQYRPMKKGITNMIRLHATGAMALPIEIRLQILASSKDVIHSWAIPSAGIKIDCVPGYSSHRVMIFLVSGIFWGQCMEICGRYHHWMPIVVYFMKRDLFFLWCTHFIFLNQNLSSTMNDKNFTNRLNLVSYDKSSWLSELY